MLKRDLFIAAMKAELYRNRAWVTSAFVLIAEGPEDWKKDPFLYRIVQTQTGHFFVNQERQLEAIEDAKDPRAAAFNIKELLTIKKGDIPNLYEESLKTSYGNYFFNWLILVWPFGGKFAYVNDRISPSGVEKMILPRLKDDPKPGDPKPKSIERNMPIYVSEYLKYVEAAYFTMGFTQLWVPADTEKTLVPPPGLKEFRAKVYAQYTPEQLKDPAIIAEIDKQLVAYDAAFLKGDDSEGFLISTKSRAQVRRKLFLQIGGEAGLNEKEGIDNIATSLDEGWDPNKFATMQNATRAGSFNRGAQTALGGEAVKWLLRVSSNMIVAKDDCGTRLGYPTPLTDKNIKKYIGFHVVSKTGHDTITEETQGEYLGKTVMVRSPMFCNLEKTDYCTVCVGPRLALNPTALSAAVTGYGSKFMQLFLAAAHGQRLETAHMDFREVLK